MTPCSNPYAVFRFLRMQGGAVTGPIIVNSSRAILYASADADFAAAARRVAQRTRDELEAARIA